MHKAVVAEGKRSEGPSELAGRCLRAKEAEYTVEISSDPPRQLTVSQSLLWQWAVAPSLQPKRLSGDVVQMRVGDRCVVAIWESRDGEVDNVQVLPRMTGKISSRPSPVAGQIEPDEHFRSIAGSRLFLKVSEIAGVQQLPAVGERVDFVLALNPERADRLWASDVTVLHPSTRRDSTGHSEGVGPAPPASQHIHNKEGGGRLADDQSSPRRTAGQVALSGYVPGRRVYVGNMPTAATWRDLSALFSTFGELLHLQVPLSDRGRPRGFGVVELASPEAAAAALRSLAGGTDIRGTRVIVRDDTALTRAAGTTAVFIGNLAPTTTWQTLAEHIRVPAAQIPIGPDGQGMGFGTAVVREPAVAEAIVAKYHNSVLEGRPLFLRLDCDTVGRDQLDAAALAEAHRSNLNFVNQVLGWVENSPPLVVTVWSEGHPSPWLGDGSAGSSPAFDARGSALRSLLWARLTAWLTSTTGSREDASLLPAKYEQHFGAKLDVRAFGFSSLRDLLCAVPTIRLEPHGSRLFVCNERPTTADVRGKRPRETAGPAASAHSVERDRRNNDSEERAHPHHEDRHKRSRATADRVRDRARDRDRGSRPRPR